MKRIPPSNRTAVPPTVAQPSAEHAALALRSALAPMAPMALWMLRNGVSYPAFADSLKAVFVAAARDELERSGSAPTQSALSLLSGVHRKDVRELGDAPGSAPASGRPPLSSQVFTRWLSDARFRGKDGLPRALPRSGTPRSFEGLCRELSNDVHPRAVLDELLRLGLVALDGDRVVAMARSFVPSARLDERTALFAANAADHIAAGVVNLTTEGPPALEQAVYADGLTPESIEVLHDAARRAWAEAFDAVVAEARQRVDRDMTSDGTMRMRFGTYFFSEPVPPVAHDAAAPPSGSSSPRGRARVADPASPVRRRTRQKNHP